MNAWIIQSAQIYRADILANAKKASLEMAFQDSVIIDKIKI